MTALSQTSRRVEVASLVKASPSSSLAILNLATSRNLASLPSKVTLASLELSLASLELTLVYLVPTLLLVNLVTQPLGQATLDIHPQNMAMGRLLDTHILMATVQRLATVCRQTCQATMAVKAGAASGQAAE